MKRLRKFARPLKTLARGARWAYYAYIHNQKYYKRFVVHLPARLKFFILVGYYSNPINMPISHYSKSPPKPQKFGVLWPSKSTNLGDDIQTIAAIKLLAENGIKDPLLLNRERLSWYRGEPVNLIMNGWFTHNYSMFRPPKQVNPIYIGFHCAKEQRIVKASVSFFKEREPIGCRDQSTVEIMRRYGIDAYFSGCLSLCLDERNEPKNDKVYLVDVEPERFPKAELDRLGEIIYTGQALGFLGLKQMRTKPLERLKLAGELLDKYSRAKLVVTRRLHCALPCRAINADVVFLHENYNGDPRFKGLEGLLNGYTLDEDSDANSVDLSRKSVDRALINKSKASISAKFSEAIDAARRA